MIGNTIGNYTIKSLIGEGGMGTVYLGEHSSLGRYVAIKVLHPQFTRNASIRARFRNEAQALAQLQHDNIVKLYDYVEEGDHAYLIMEHAEGDNLDDIVRHQTGPMPTERLRVIFPQILSAMAYAHSKGIVHRDIKPSNFILTPDDQVKVLDFGIAKVLGDSQQNLTKTGTRMGTVFYMSPEQVRGQQVDHRSDIYGLGVMLFVLATGKMPYEELPSEYEIFNKIVHEPLPAAYSLYPGVSPRVEGLIRKATAKDPMQRFQSCVEFRHGHGTNPYVQGPGPGSPQPGYTTQAPGAFNTQNPGGYPQQNPGDYSHQGGYTTQAPYGQNAFPNSQTNAFPQTNYPAQPQITKTPALPGSILAYTIIVLSLFGIGTLSSLTLRNDEAAMGFLIGTLFIVPSVGTLFKQNWARIFAAVMAGIILLSAIGFIIFVAVSMVEAMPRRGLVPSMFVAFFLTLAAGFLGAWGLIVLTRKKYRGLFK